MLDNAGVLVHGWTACEYLLNTFFKTKITTKDDKDAWRNSVNNSSKYPWAFYRKSNQLKKYDDLIGDAHGKIELMSVNNMLGAKLEVTGRAQNLYDALMELKKLRNDFVHNPAGQDSAVMLRRDHYELYNKIKEVLGILEGIVA